MKKGLIEALPNMKQLHFTKQLEVNLTPDSPNIDVVHP